MRFAPTQTDVEADGGGSMRRPFVTVSALALILGGSVACATKGYIRGQVGSIDKKVESLWKAVDKEAGSSATTAQAVADAARTKADSAQAKAEAADAHRRGSCTTSPSAKTKGTSDSELSNCPTPSNTDQRSH